MSRMSNMTAVRQLAAAVILVSVTAGTALAAPSQVNISGATLFSGFFRAYASTNDWIDVNHDGIFGFSFSDLRTPEQLALSNWQAPNTWWIVIYRGVGSGNGLKELVNYHSRKPGMEIGNPTDVSTINRNQFYSASGPLGDANSSNPASAPIPIQTVDIAVMDVPTTWFVQAGSQANAQWNRLLMSDGYGQGPVKAWNAPTQSNKLKTLTSSLDSTVVLNVNTGHPDSNTVFDTPIAWVPIAFVANAGTGLQNVTQQQLDYLFTTGRMPSGENLVACTRDSGSGTRNGAMNSIGVDPSWGRGENLGTQTKDAMVASRLGPNHQASNLGGADHMEEVVRQTRLAVGYTGLMGTSRAANRAQLGQLEVLNLEKSAGSVFVRPTIAGVLATGDINSSWQVGGAETFATVGSPFQTDYPMANQAAADYLRNIKQSITDFVSAPSDPCLYGMPGEYLAYTYTLAAGLTNVPSAIDPTVFVPNPDFKSSIYNYILQNTTMTLPAYGTVNTAGQVPNRAQLTGGQHYSDGRTYVGTDGYYTDSSGAPLIAGTNLSKRNRISGDFNYDGKRDLKDIPFMMAAIADPNSFEAGDNNGADGYVCVQIIGDFNGDGNFDANDIRYFADGLAIDPVTGLLDRATGFFLVDLFSSTGNFFGTKLATGVPYKFGDSKADIAGSGKTYAGAQPVGSDGKVDAKDIDYVRHVMNGGLAADVGMTVNFGGRLDWRIPEQAVWMDLSCDMNGDLVIDQSDVDVIVKEVLGTKYGDVNLDGVVDAKDLAIVNANLGKTNAGWADGDMDGDGIVTAADLAIVQAAMNTK